MCTQWALPIIDVFSSFIDKRLNIWIHEWKGKHLYTRTLRGRRSGIDVNCFGVEIFEAEVVVFVVVVFPVFVFVVTDVSFGGDNERRSLGRRWLVHDPMGLVLGVTKLGVPKMNIQRVINTECITMTMTKLMKQESYRLSII